MSMCTFRKSPALIFTLLGVTPWFENPLHENRISRRENFVTTTECWPRSLGQIDLSPGLAKMQPLSDNGNYLVGKLKNFQSVFVGFTDGWE